MQIAYEDKMDHSHFNKLKDLPEMGRAKRLNSFKRALSLFFDQTKKEGKYANNRNSKGRYVPVFITLTYPDNESWNPEDISNYIRNII